MSKKKIPWFLRAAIRMMDKRDYPELPEKPETGRWYKISPSGFVASDGSQFRFYLHLGTENKMMIYFYGGGISWNEHMAANPITLDAEVGCQQFYSPSTRYAQLTLGKGLLSTGNDSPFKDWSILAIPYCTGDFHCGTTDFPYRGNDGKSRILHHHGYTNYREALGTALKYIGDKPDALLIFGSSAGGFGTSLLSDDIIMQFPDCREITVYADSCLFLKDNWQEIVRDVWKAPKHIYEKLGGNNIAVDSFMHLRRKYGERVRLLFSCSVRDGALSEVQEYITNGKLCRCRQGGDVMQENLRVTCERLSEIGTALYIFDTPAEKGKKQEEWGLTQHCTAEDSKTCVEGITVKDWVWGCMNGNKMDVGIALLDKEY